MLNDVAALAKKELKQDIALQIGWYDAKEQFTVVAGSVDAGGALRDAKPDDTFLYGSGTKPIVASAVMRLIDQGKIKASDPAHQHIDPYLQKNNGTTMAELFGEEVRNATVMDLIRMTAGIPDFEAGPRDQNILNAGDKVWPVYDNIRYAASYQKEYGGSCKTADDCDSENLPLLTKAYCIPKVNKCIKAGPYIGCFGKPDGTHLPGPEGWTCYHNSRVASCRTKKPSKALICEPGKCGYYSSAGYELAGLLVAAVETPQKPYTDMNVGDVTFPDGSQYPSLSFVPLTSPNHTDVASMKISDKLTVPGHASKIFSGSDATIMEQNPTILGWTCGHMVGSAGDVGKFFHDLLDENTTRPIVSPAALFEMKRFKPLTLGWGGGSLWYGAGLMASAVSMNKSYQPVHPDQWGFYVGHGGLTYGFSSNQGYLPQAQAGFSVTSNTDIPYFSGLATCRMFQIAADVFSQQKVYLNCSMYSGGPFLQAKPSRSMAEAAAHRLPVEAHKDSTTEVVV